MTHTITRMLVAAIALTAIPATAQLLAGGPSQKEISNQVASLVKVLSEPIIVSLTINKDGIRGETYELSTLPMRASSHRQMTVLPYASECKVGGDGQIVLTTKSLSYGTSADFTAVRISNDMVALNLSVLYSELNKVDMMKQGECFVELPDVDSFTLTNRLDLARGDTKEIPFKMKGRQYALLVRAR